MNVFGLFFDIYYSVLYDICTALGFNCTDGDVRLIDGTSQYIGRVEVCIDNTFTSVCDDTSWGSQEATIVCTQLGFTNGSKGLETTIVNLLGLYSESDVVKLVLLTHIIFGFKIFSWSRYQWWKFWVWERRHQSCRPAVYRGRTNSHKLHSSTKLSLRFLYS